MDTLTLRILETLSTNIGDPASINQLTERIKKERGTAYYANIYEKLQDLKKQGSVTLDPIGKSSSVKLNFKNYLLVDILAEMELEKKRQFLAQENNLQPLLTEIEEVTSNYYMIKSIIAAEPGRNLKLNRIELLVLLAQTPNNQNETILLSKEMQKLEKRHNLKIDTLILNKTQFQNLATTDEINPVREILGNRVILFGSEAFWTQIKEVTNKSEIKTIKEPIKIAKISETDIGYNLNRFGYSELGRNVNPGNRICLEYLTTALLIQDDARLREAAPVILAKNRLCSNLLAFLSQKYGTTGTLKGIIKILQEFKPTQEINQAIALLSVFDTEETPADKESIQAKLRLYNAL